MGGLALSGMVLTLARFSVGNPVVAAAPGRAATIEDLTYDPASPPREPEDPSVLKGTHGTAAFTLGLRPTAPGPYTFEVWVLDAGRNLSNVLTGQIDVSEPSPTEP